MVVVGSLYYLPLYYEAVQGLSPILSNVALFPRTFTVAPAFIVGTLISRTGHYRWAVWSGWTTTTLGLDLLFLLDVHTSTIEWIFLNLVVGVGLGFNYSALAVTLQAATSEEDMSSAVAMFTFFRLMGQALGVVIGGVTFQDEIRTKLLAIPSLAPMADQYANDDPALAQQIKTIQDSTDRNMVVQVYADSLKTVWAVLCETAGLALLTSLIITDLSLDRQFISPQQIPSDSDNAALLDNKVEEGGHASIPARGEDEEYGTAETTSEMTALPHWYGTPRLMSSTIADNNTNHDQINNQRASTRFSQSSSAALPNDNRTSYQSSRYSRFTNHDSSKCLSSPPPAHQPHPHNQRTSMGLPSIPDQPLLAKMMVNDFDVDRELPTIVPNERQSRIIVVGAGNERLTSWAPVYGMG